MVKAIEGKKRPDLVNVQVGGQEFHYQVKQNILSVFLLTTHTTDHLYTLYNIYIMSGWTESVRIDKFEDFESPLLAQSTPF